MAEALRQACAQVFQYSDAVTVRRHGPRGYADYQLYKPWLRDEFAFRCVYCLWRERWEANGADGFGVDHIQAQASRPEQRLDYDNLLYACNTCNSTRRDVKLTADPASDAPGHHLQVLADGTVRALSPAGEALIDLCRLNRALLVAARRRILNLIAVLSNSNALEATEVLRDLLAFPTELPNLAALRPPEGNARPDGVGGSYYERRRRGELVDVY
jgi:hypothetical protein